MTTLPLKVRAVLPGLGIALVIAAAATFLSEHYTAPLMLYALLLGMAFNFLTETERTKSGIDFASRGLLRIGVALLGIRIGWDQVTSLGLGPVLSPRVGFHPPVRFSVGRGNRHMRRFRRARAFRRAATA